MTLVTLKENRAYHASIVALLAPRFATTVNAEDRALNDVALEVRLTCNLRIRNASSDTHRPVWQFLFRVESLQ